MVAALLEGAAVACVDQLGSWRQGLCCLVQVANDCDESGTEEFKEVRRAFGKNFALAKVACSPLHHTTLT
jgi:hypothetical protein